VSHNETLYVRFDEKAALALDTPLGPVRSTVVERGKQ